MVSMRGGLRRTFPRENYCPPSVLPAKSNGPRPSCVMREPRPVIEKPLQGLNPATAFLSTAKADRLKGAKAP